MIQLIHSKHQHSITPVGKCIDGEELYNRFKHILLNIILLGSPYSMYMYYTSYKTLKLTSYTSFIWGTISVIQLS